MSKCTTYVIQVELIVCKADIMRDPVTPRIPAGALLTNPALRERDNGLSSCEARGGDRGWQCIIHLQQLGHAMGYSCGKSSIVDALSSSQD